MNKKEMEEFRKKLLNLREQLWIEVKHKHAEASDLRDTGVPDPGDASMTDDLRDFLHVLSDSKREQILEIDEAIRRIEDGSYGICARCEEEINMKRLEVQPDTPYCVSCKEELEEREAVKSGPEQGKI
jgi:DnaK suppressor protein